MCDSQDINSQERHQTCDDALQVNTPELNGASRNGGTDIKEIEEYLSGLSRKNEFVDPKLKNETRKLVDLLKSYKNLSEELDRKCAEAAKEGIEVPTKEILCRRAEIYALLHPELYKNRREEEKIKLIEKFSTKRQFTEVDKVIPTDLTPIHVVSDKRQLEKERFCRLVSSAPTRFHNCLDQPSPRFKRLTRPPPTPQLVVDVRESEKERLARIFATSVALTKLSNPRKNILRNLPTKGQSSRPLSPATSHNTNFDVLQLRNGNHSFGKSLVNEPSSDVDAMVRIGEYSPHNKYTNPARGRTVLGVGEHEEKKKMLAEERYNECRDFLNKARQEKIDEAVMVSPSEVPRFLSTISTQTECLPFEREAPIRVVQSHKYVDVSPREKLLFDLYGHRSASIQEEEEKRKQIAYAMALKEQIEDKKRLEEERKRREREEEEMIERRFQEQLERIQREQDGEIEVRLPQEDILNRRLAQLNLEEEELKKREKLSRLTVESERTKRSSYTNDRYIAAATNGLQAHVNGGKAVDRMAASSPSSAVLPEKLPEPSWDQDWSQIQLKGVDLLREHRTSKDRLQLPPLIDPSSKVQKIVAKSGASSPVDGYVPSTMEDAFRRAQNSRQKAEALLKAPLDEPIICRDQLPKPPQRAPSPVVPAVRTERIMKNNSKILNDKWNVPPKGSNELDRTGLDRNNVLTQLGAFRRQLALECRELEGRIREMVPP